MVLFYDKQNTNFQALLQLNRLISQPVKLTLDFKKKNTVYFFILFAFYRQSKNEYFLFSPKSSSLSLIESSKLQDFN
jgi:hypothetical protein